VTDHVRAVAAYGLRSTRELPTAPLEPDDFQELLGSCVHERLLGLLGSAVRAGAFSVTDEQHDQFETQWRSWLTHALRVERLLIDATRALDRAGIESRVLKGAALARTAYDDVSQRVFGDVDLLVPGDQLTRAAEVVADALGGVRAQPELRPGFDDRFGKEAMVRVGALELDLHRTFVEGGLGLTIRLADLFAPPYRFPVGGVELEALPMPPRFLHACYAAALGDWPPRLMSLRDVAQIALRERPHLVDVLLMAREWQCQAVVARAVSTAWQELALTDRAPIVDWADQYRPSRRERWLIAAHEGPGRAVTRHLAALAVLPGVRDRLAYATAVVAPQRAYLEARGFTLAGNLRRAARKVRS